MGLEGKGGFPKNTHTCQHRIILEMSTRSVPIHNNKHQRDLIFLLGCCLFARMFLFGFNFFSECFFHISDTHSDQHGVMTTIGIFRIIIWAHMFFFFFRVETGRQQSLYEFWDLTDEWLLRFFGHVLGFCMITTFFTC